MNQTPQSWVNVITKAVGTLVIVAIVLYIVEHVFLEALPALLVVLALIGAYRVALGMWRQRDGW